MRFRNYEIKPLGEFLSSESLAGKNSRMRTRFVNILNEHLIQVVEKERIQLIKEFADKDEKGEIILNDDLNTPLFSNDNLNKFNEEYMILMNEYFHIPYDESTKEMIDIVGRVLLNSETEISGKEATQYDGWCTEFESLFAEEHT